LGLTKKEKEILRLSASYGYFDYRIGQKVKTGATSVARSHCNSLEKIERAKPTLSSSIFGGTVA
jgi:hypothetical protein